MTLRGTDLSKWNAEGVPLLDFVVMKATQGVSEVDRTYAQRLADNRAAGRLIGSYAYADGVNPVSEATYYVRNANRLPNEIQALDFESSPGVNTVADPVGWALIWLVTVESLTGNKPLIYMNGNTVQRYNWLRVVKNNNGLWCAAYQSAQPSSGQWPFMAMWQNADNGAVAPLGNVDTDIFFGDKSMWLKYASTTPVAPKPTPTPTPSVGRNEVPLIVAVDPKTVPPNTPWPGIFRLGTDNSLHHIHDANALATYKAAGDAIGTDISYGEYLEYMEKR